GVGGEGGGCLRRGVGGGMGGARVGGGLSSALSGRCQCSQAVGTLAVATQSCPATTSCAASMTASIAGGMPSPDDLSKATPHLAFSTATPGTCATAGAVSQYSLTRAPRIGATLINIRRRL